MWLRKKKRGGEKRKGKEEINEVFRVVFTRVSKQGSSLTVLKQMYSFKSQETRLRFSFCFTQSEGK